MSNNFPISALQFASGKRTICEVLREINDLHQGQSKEDLKIRELLDEAISMAKKMSRKLLHYNKKAFSKFWEENPNYEKDLNRRLDLKYKIAFEKFAFDEKYKQSIKIADRIPHMGAKNIQEWLLRAAHFVPEKTAIVEIGAWLGSGTAYLLIGNDSKNKIFVYDHFFANASEAEKAKRFKIDLKPGTDTLPIVRDNLKKFKGNITFIKEKLLDMEWGGDPIGLLVDDVSKGPEAWNHTVKNFLPHVVAGGKIILMDYFYFEKTERPHHKTQYNFMQKHKKNFRFLRRSADGSEAMFLVLKKFRGEK